MKELRIYGNDLAKVQVHWYSVIYFASQLCMQRYAFYLGTPRNCSFFCVLSVISWPVRYCSSVKVSFCKKGVGWNEFRQPLSYYGISERNVRFWSLNSRLDNRQAENPFMAMRERYFYGVLPFSFFVVLLGASETVLMIHPYVVRAGHRHWRHGWKKVRISASNRGFDDGCADYLSYGTTAFTTCAFCFLLKAELE